PAADGKRVPEKSRGLLRQDQPVAERCAVIEAEKATYPIAWMCQLLGVPRSSFYYWRERVAAESATAARRPGPAPHRPRGVPARPGALRRRPGAAPPD